MAVVQISRIQIRRGKAQEGTGLPQLASGEMAWAIDTQELWIGNGSVAEGAPAVGNTKIVTTKDLSAGPDLLKLIAYEYRSDENITVDQGVPYIRNIQSRLDDFATSTNFGIVGDYNAETGIGTLTDGARLQFAINQLFLNESGKASVPSESKSRVILHIMPGTYLLTQPIYVPSYTTLIGAGADKTILYYKPETITVSGITVLNSIQITCNSVIPQSIIGSNIVGTNVPDSTVVTDVTYPDEASSVIHISNPATGSSLSNIDFEVTSSDPAIKFVNDLSEVGAPGSFNDTTGINQPRKIQVSDMTVHTATGMNSCLQLDAVRDSLFENLELYGTTDGVFHHMNEMSRGLSMHAKNSSQIGQAQVTTENNIFRNIRFSGFGYAVYAQEDILNNIFENCLVTEARQGFVLGIASDGVTQGQVNGPRQTQIINTKFNKVYQHGVYCERGTQNSVTGCTLVNVGVDGGGNINATNVLYPQIYFEAYGNTISNNNSDRPGDFENANFEIPYIPVLGGHGLLSSLSANAVYLGGIDGTLMRLPMPSNAQGVPTGSISYTIDYTFKNDTAGKQYARVGAIIIAADADTGKIQVSDEYNYAGADTNIADNALAFNISASFLDAAGQTYIPGSGNPPYGILLTYTNTGFALTGQFIYTYKAVV